VFIRKLCLGDSYLKCAAITDVQIHWRKNDYLSMSLLEDFDSAESKVSEFLT